MSQLRIEQLDPHDRAVFDAWHAAYDEAHRYGREQNSAMWSLEQLRAIMQEEARRRFVVGFVGWVGDRVVCCGDITGSLLDNRDLGEVSIATVPDQRGRGFGSAMLAHVEAAARERGRTRLTAQVHWPFDADPAGVGEPAVEWARRRGYVVGLVDIQRQLRLPVDEAVLDALATEAAPHHAAYTLRSWVGPVPDEFLQGWAELTSTLMTEAPLGEMEREPEAADVAAVRESEALVARQGRVKYCTVALEADGALVAYTELVASRDKPPRAYQWGTLVRRADRGHRLGMAVKVANLRLMQRERPDLTTVFTWNAEVNDHMVGINQRLGFMPTERSGELQKKLTRR